MIDILIPTLHERKAQFERLKAKIEMLASEKEVSIIQFPDNRQHSIGYKRNALLQAAKRKYVAFIDDDDDISAMYFENVEKMALDDADCCALVGTMYTDGGYPRRFEHSIAYSEYEERNGIYLRPPNHLNPMKRSIAQKFRFPDNSFGEDTDWAMQVQRSGLLKSEHYVVEPYYFYHYIRKKSS